MKNSKWTAQHMPEQSGKTFIVTGANSGIGYETTKELVAKGATVIMACRNLDKANKAANMIRADYPQAILDIIQLDLANLASIHDFATNFKAKYQTLDGLINNAGIMIPPFTKTQDGFEVQFGANHLGHFALTGLLMDRIVATPKARIVNVSSTAHRRGKIDFNNLNAEQGYQGIQAYAQSKLANLLFTYELQKRLDKAGIDTLAVAAHPGWSLTNLQRGVVLFLSRIFGQSQALGALPTLYAATMLDVKGDDYYGPNGFAEMRGYPKKVGTIPEAKDDAVAQQLWNVSEEMTGVSFQFS